MNNSKLNCPQAKKCGGCQLSNMDYARQLNFKQAKVVKLLGKFHRVNKIIGMKCPFNYRNKVSAAFTTTRSGKVISGVYQSATKSVVSIDKCAIEDKFADEIIVAIRKMLPDFKIKPFNEFNGKGFLRHVLVKRGFSTNQTMVVLVGANKIFPQKEKFCKALVEKFPEITTVVFNVSTDKLSMLLGDYEEVLFGNGYIEDVLCGLTFRISAKSFYQVNPVGAEILYNKAIEFANITKEDTVIDAYCGTGTIGLACAKFAKQVIGVELNKDAVKDAEINAKNNNITNAQFFCADATDFIKDYANSVESVDVVILDPPRKGSTKAFLKSVVALNPSRVVYVSCNPETQKRDLFELTKAGYKVKRIQPVDMFPHTSHVETVVALSK